MHTTASGTFGPRTMPDGSLYSGSLLLGPLAVRHEVDRRLLPERFRGGEPRRLARNQTPPDQVRFGAVVAAPGIGYGVRRC